MKKQKIVLIHPPSPYLLIPKWVVPITLLYLRSFLVENNYEVEIIDLSAEEKDYLLKIPLDADYYGIHVYTAQHEFALQIGQFLKQNTDALLLAGGHHVTFIDKLFLENSNFDIVVRGEGETALLEILEGKQLSDIVGITYRDGSEVIRNVDRPLIPDLDVLPYTRLEGIDLKDYPGTYIRKPHSEYKVGVIFSRGCVGNCSFCSSPGFWKRKIRFHSYKWIENYIEYLVDYGIREIEIYDDNFIIHKEFNKICTLLKKYNILWGCMAISKHITPDKVNILSNSGCLEVSLGIESGSEKELNMIGKISTVEDNHKAVSLLKEKGINARGYLIVGLPDCQQADIDATINFIKKSSIDRYGLSTFVPLPGTAIWNYPEKYNTVIDPHKSFSDYIMLGKTLDIDVVTKETEKVNSYRQQLLEVLGDKCTLFESFRKSKKYNREK